MQFNDVADGNGIIQDITQITNATLTDYPIADRTRDINNAYSKVAHLIIQSNGRMQWDDTNTIDQPISEANLFSGQEDYNVFDSVPTALEDWVTIERVEAKNEDGNFVLLKPIDKREVNDQSWTEFRSTDGVPEFYDFNGTSLLLKPNPSYNSTKGLKIYFQRAPQFFVASDITKRPGFATLFHPYLSMWAGYRWARDKGLKNAAALKSDMIDMADEIQRHYSRRANYEQPALKRKPRNFR